MVVVTRDGSQLWVAAREGSTVGRLRASVRPNGHWYLSLGDCAPEELGGLLDAALGEVGSPVYAEVDEADAARRRQLAGRGFAAERREHHYMLPTDPVRAGLEGSSMPSGFATLSAADADVDRLRQLDEALRDDVPGGAGWRWDPEEFIAQTFDPSAFDPATYLVAIDESTGAYAGLARVWLNPEGPRLGLIGVLPAYRRRGLARALLGLTFGVLHDRGMPEVSCEVDETNSASDRLMASLGARRTGGMIELVRR